MRGTPQRRHRLVPIAIAVCLLLPLMTDGAEAGHRSHFSMAIGFPFAFHFGYPYFHLAYTPYAPPHHHAVAVPVRSNVGAIRLRVKPKKTDWVPCPRLRGHAGNVGQHAHANVGMAPELAVTAFMRSARGLGNLDPINRVTTNTYE